MRDVRIFIRKVVLRSGLAMSERSAEEHHCIVARAACWCYKSSEHARRKRMVTMSMGQGLDDARLLVRHQK